MSDLTLWLIRSSVNQTLGEEWIHSLFCFVGQPVNYNETRFPRQKGNTIFPIVFVLLQKISSKHLWYVHVLCDHHSGCKNRLNSWVYMFAVMTFNVPNNLRSPIKPLVSRHPLKTQNLKHHELDIIDLFSCKMQCEIILSLCYRPCSRHLTTEPIDLRAMELEVQDCELVSM